MFTHSNNTASFFFGLMAALILSFSLAGGAAAQSNTLNTSLGTGALQNNTTGSFNTATGASALFSNTTGNANTASGLNVLTNNTTGNNNTAIGAGANVSAGNLTNATAIGNAATVNDSNKIRLGNAAVTVIEGEVTFTAVSDKTKKENFQPVDGEEVLGKIRGFELSSWNFIGHDPKRFRHYGPMAQDFYAAFGHDGVGEIGSETTINSGDIAGILMIAVQALEKRTAELKQKEVRIAVLESRLEALELRKNHAIQIAAEVMQ
jgi:Chaperone of endosialidase